MAPCHSNGKHERTHKSQNQLYLTPQHYIYISHSTPLKKKRTLSFGEGYIHYILPIHLQPTTTLFTHTHTHIPQSREENAATNEKV